MRWRPSSSTSANLQAIGNIFSTKPCSRLRRIPTGRARRSSAWMASCSASGLSWYRSRSAAKPSAPTCSSRSTSCHLSSTISRATGRVSRTPRPWLGLSAAESQGQLVVGSLSVEAPAAKAGIKPGDRILEVVGQRVDGLSDLLRKVWRLGPAGTEIPLTLGRGQTRSRVQVRSTDRDLMLKKPQLHWATRSLRFVACALRGAACVRRRGAAPVASRALRAATCKARDRRRNTVIVGEWMPHSIWLMYVRSTLDFADSKD